MFRWSFSFSKSPGRRELAKIPNHMVQITVSLCIIIILYMYSIKSNLISQAPYIGKHSREKIFADQ